MKRFLKFAALSSDPAGLGLVVPWEFCRPNQPPAADERRFVLIDFDMDSGRELRFENTRRD